MTKKLEEEFNLPSIDDVNETQNNEATKNFDVDVTAVDIEDVQTALTNAEKIDHALQNVKGLEEHDSEMDDIAQQAVDSYQQLMNLGMNVGDREAGSIFDSAAKMLKTALEAKDSKIDSKLKQIDLMIKKGRLDNNAQSTSTSGSNGTVVDRNELLKIINTKEK
jgi:hypothetical protein|tara:strand:- start:2038 stop:2529 length:492 start_codon:yes stop_codon:yes gene_type:complete